MRAFIYTGLFIVFSRSVLCAAVQWREGFEGLPAGWTIEGATWEFGKPTAAGGPTAFAGANVAGTVLAGNYGATHDAKLITPRLEVPAAAESPRFVYRYWYQIGVHDFVQLQVRAADGEWRDLPGTRLTESGMSWARQSVDLRAYAGQSIQFAFRFVAAFDNRAGDLALGMYVDEVALETGPVTLEASPGFENGFGDWAVEGGVWQVGSPAPRSGPIPFRGSNLAGTSLTGNYGTAHDARLISPEFAVPPADRAPRFSYLSWYAIGRHDYGQVQIRSVGGEWQEVPGGRLTESAETWARCSIDLRPYAGRTVQIAFRLVSRYENRAGDVAAGWFIDDPALETGSMDIAASEGFEAGFGAWSVENGVWQVGAPKVNGGPTAFAGRAVAGTTLTGHYGTVHDARLVTPEFAVPQTTSRPRFSYYYWYSFGRSDHGQLQIRAAGEDWQDVPGERLTGTGGKWARRSVDLRSFAGKSVQLGFRLVSAYGGYAGDLAPGWFIDEAKFETGPMVFTAPESFEAGFGDWSVEGGVWQVGTPAARGRPSAFSGENVGGTMLASNYPDGAEARLVSPEFIVPPALRGPELNFQHWHSLLPNDKGRIEISVAGGGWTPLGKAIVGSTAEWQRSSCDLSHYAGHPVRIAFHLVSDRHGGSGGWYIDDVKLGTVEPTALTLGAPVAGTLPSTGARMLYRLEVPSAGHLRFQLDDLDDRGTNEMYVRRDVPPTVSEYDFRFKGASADQSLFAPNAGAGIWYVTVLGSTVPNDGSAYRLMADFFEGIALLSVTPSRVGNAAPAVLDLTGAGFDGAASIELHDGASKLATATVTPLGPDRIRGDLSLSGVPPGRYQVTVTQGAHSASLPFEVTAEGHPRFEAKVIAPGRVGRHAPATLFVEYSNLGDIAIPAPLLVLHGSSNALLTVDEMLFARAYWVESYPAGFSDNVYILAGGNTPGVLQPGETKRVPVYFRGLMKPWDMKNARVEFRLGTLDRTNTNPVDWDAMKAKMRPAHVTEDGWNIIWTNLKSAVGKTWGEYVTMLNSNATYLAALGVNVHDVRELLEFEIGKADGLALFRAIRSSTDTELAQPGIPLLFQRQFGTTTSQRFHIGALGRGWRHNWEARITTRPDGMRMLHEPDGRRRDFQPSARGGFINDPGDYSKITATRENAIVLQEVNGQKRGFRPDGRPSYVEDPNGNRITAEYAGSQLVKLTHSAGAHLTFVYAGTLLQSVTDSNGQSTTYSFDTEGHLAAAKNSSGLSESYTYDSTAHALTVVTEPDNRRQHFAYDNRGRLASVSRDRNAERILFAYEELGTMTVQDDQGGKVTVRFDHRGLLADVDDALKRRVKFARDKNLNLISLTGPDGGTVRFDYDNRGNPVRILDALGGTTSLTFTAANRIQRISDPRQQITKFDRDRAGNVASIADADGSRTQSQHDAQGNLIKHTNRRGQSTTFSRDAAGRIVRKVLAEGRSFDCRYDERGNLIEVVDSTLGSTAMRYDEHNRLVGVNYPGGQGFTFTYDERGRRKSRKGHDGYVLRYHYDEAGRMARLEEGNARSLVVYSYDGAGRLTGEKKGNGSSSTYAYNAMGQLTELINRAPDGSVTSRFDSTYDVQSNPTAVKSLSGTTRYFYDALGQLTKAINPDGRTSLYRYDATGNRVAAIENGVETNYVSNALNQYTQAGSVRFAYDRDGNVTQRTDASGSTQFTYDSENRLTQIKSPAGEWTFGYNAFGQRISVIHNGVTRNLIPDPIGWTDIAAEFDGNGALVARYDNGLGLARQLTASGVEAYYNFDPIGSARELTGAGGAVLNQYDYEAFGAPRLIRESIPNPFTFVGRFGVSHGPVGLLNMRRRDYDPVLGRFTTRDPIGLDGDINLFRYAGNTPTLKIDPTGEVWGYALAGAAAVLIYWGFYETADIGVYGQLDPDNPDKMIRMEKERTSPQRDLQKQGSVGVGNAAGTISGLPTSNKGAFELFWKFLGTYVLTPVVDFFNQVGTLIAAAFDPNELIGPAGYGPSNHVPGADPFAYRLNFENDAKATAPAQIVELRNPLPADLDLETFEMTSVGFGDFVAAIPPGSQRFERTASIAIGDTTIEVGIEAYLDVAKRELHAKFSSLNPDTGLPPAVGEGFLPPEDGTGRGKGHVSYLSRPKPGLSTGTEIRNIGFVTFDPLAGGPTFRTDLSDVHNPNSSPNPARQALVTIDADTPNSRVTAMPAKSWDESIQVNWSGTDRGSGIASYDIHVQTDGGPWTLWMRQTADTKAVWKGGYGHRYGFYSAASDGVGHREPAPEAQSPAHIIVTMVRPLWQERWLWIGLIVSLGALAVIWRIRSTRTPRTL